MRAKPVGGLPWLDRILHQHFEHADREYRHDPDYDSADDFAKWRISERGGKLHADGNRNTVDWQYSSDRQRDLHYRFSHTDSRAERIRGGHLHRHRANCFRTTEPVGGLPGLDRILYQHFEHTDREYCHKSGPDPYQYVARLCDGRGRDVYAYREWERLCQRFDSLLGKFCAFDPIRQSIATHSTSNSRDDRSGGHTNCNHGAKPVSGRRHIEHTSIRS